MRTEQADHFECEIDRKCGGFTLVELLVVIGIIALLIAILLPALTHARQQAMRTSCAARLHEILIAAQMHRMEHQDYYPLAGTVNGITPENLDDMYCTKYDYFSNQVAGIGGIQPNQKIIPRRLMPITDSLAYEMGYKNQVFMTSNYNEVQLMYDPQSFIKPFMCPGQANDFGELAPQSPPFASFLYCATNSSLTDFGEFYSEPMSFVWNEAVLGWNDTYGRLRGRASLVHQPSLTVFVADGLHGATGTELGNNTPPGATTGGFGSFALCNFRAKPPITLADALNGVSGNWVYNPSQPPIAADPASFDKKRHQGKINIGFCDGHVECRDITTSDLSKFFLLAP